jgi:hypothetical protein
LRQRKAASPLPRLQQFQFVRQTQRLHESRQGRPDEAHGVVSMTDPVVHAALRTHMLARLGIVPQQIAGGDVYSALEKG